MPPTSSPALTEESGRKHTRKGSGGRFFARFRARGRSDTHLLWRGAGTYVAALIIFLYPFLFIIDEAFDFAFSPVLPGVVVLALLWISLPLLLVEFLGRRWRRMEDERVSAKLTRLFLGSRRAFVASLIWFVGWLTLGT